MTLHRGVTADLTLTGQRGCCRNIKRGSQNIWELPQPKAMPTFSYGCDFMMGLGKHQLRAKFEVTSLSRCRNIVGKPKF